MEMKKTVLRWKRVLAVLVGLFVLSPVVVYFMTGFFLYLFVTLGSSRLIALEEQGRLSSDYGFVWQEINLNQRMSSISLSDSGPESSKVVAEVDVPQRNPVEIPSLRAITELNTIRDFHKVIRITDRNGIPLSEIRTTHTCVDISEVNELLIRSLIKTEDQRFYSRKRAYDYNALVRSVVDALYRSFSTRRFQLPRATSTIHMQVARFLMLRTNTMGYAYTERSIRRKMREIQLAEALKRTFSDEEILSVYINHCVSAGRGMRGYHDISKGLFGVHPSQINTAQSLYLARLVKWNRHLPERIIGQVKASLPELSRHFGWQSELVESVKDSLDHLTFRPFRPVISQNSHLLDLANEYWREICRHNGMDTRELGGMDIANPESMIRRFGNLTIALTIDYRLQKKLEQLVHSRGFGPDTTVRTDIRIGSKGTDLYTETVPPDTVRNISVVTGDSIFVDPVSGSAVELVQNDTVVTNIRYRKTDQGSVRRSVFYYKRGELTVPGQYFAYAIMDSDNRQLLAYYSRDRLGSRLTSLLRNRTPNGSSVAKPILFALAYDLGIYEEAEIATDEHEISQEYPWARTFVAGEDGTPIGMRYLNTANENGYTVHNHHRGFEGFDFMFNHLYRSNNILAVETIYRLNTEIHNRNNPYSARVVELLRRTNSQSLLRNRYITGADLYKAIAGVVSGDVYSPFDSNTAQSQIYSVALGTLELSLFEQMHLFNVLYDNKLPVNPSEHPGLFIKNVWLGGQPVAFSDTLEYVNLLSSLESLRPVALALHKRLVSSPADRLGWYDVCLDTESLPSDGLRLSNFAKSGTSDDVIRPFNVDVTSASRTNYGLWHGVLRVKLTRDDLVGMVGEDSRIDSTAKTQIRFDQVPYEQVFDITIASVGEGNAEYTGSRDGKSLHGYLTRELLHQFGIPCTSGFFSGYEDVLINSRSREERYFYKSDESDLSFFSRNLIRLRTIGNAVSANEVKFERTRSGALTLRGSSYRRMLGVAQYMGNQSRNYRDLVNRLRKVGSENEASEILDRIESIEMDNRILQREIGRLVGSLRRGLE